MVIKETKFKDVPVFAIFRNEEEANKDKAFPIVSFGLPKAKAILQNIEALKAFVAKHENGGT